MKRKTAVALGNTLMGIGLVSMVGGVAFTVLGMMKDFVMAGSLAHLPVMGIFVGALIWLVGARVSGRERVAERYWWIKHCDRNNNSYRHKHL